jgi:transposase InsO family protein
MRCAGVHGRAPKRWTTTTIPDPAATTRADLIRRDFTTDAANINARWCNDTYINTWEGWLYLATVIDIASRRVVGWATAEHLRTDLIDQALRNAVTHRRPGRRVDGGGPACARVERCSVVGKAVGSSPPRPPVCSKAVSHRPGGGRGRCRRTGTCCAAARRPAPRGSGL